MTHTSTARKRAWRTAVAVLTIAGTMAVGSPSAFADSPRVTTCLRPDGTSVQQFAGLSVSVVLPFYPGCDTIKSGATWTTGFGWYATKSWEGIPAGYVPVGSAPIQDFVSHLVSARILVDAGTPEEFSVVWPNSPALLLYADAQYDYASGITLGTIRPLSVGRHTLQRFITLSGVTCDGTSADPNLSCAPGGELAYDDPADPLVFSVVR